MKKFFTFIILLIVSNIVLAQNVSTVLNDIQNYKLLTLPNGFRVQVVTSSQYNFCNCRLTADVANIEEDKKPGIKSVVAAITGSELIADEIIVKNMVSHDQALDSLLEFMSHVIYGNSSYNVDFNEYKQKRINYLNLSANDIQKKISDIATQKIGRTPLSKDYMNNISKEDYETFRSKCFSPDRCLLTIISSMDVAEIQELVTKYFGESQKVVFKSKPSSVDIKPSDKIYFINDSSSQDVFFSYKDFFLCKKTPKNYVYNKVALHLLFGEYYVEVKDFSTYNYDIYSFEGTRNEGNFSYLTTHLYHPRSENYLIDTSLKTAKSETVSDFYSKLESPDFACEIASYLLLYNFEKNFFTNFEANVNAVTESEMLSFIKTINQNGSNALVINGFQRQLHCSLLELSKERELDIIKLNQEVVHVFQKGFGIESIFNDYLTHTGLNNCPKSLGVNYKTVYDYLVDDVQYKADGRIIRKIPNHYLLENYILHLDSIRVFHYKESFDGEKAYDSTMLYGMEDVDSSRFNVLKQKAAFPQEAHYLSMGYNCKLICDYDLFQAGLFKIELEDLNHKIFYNYYNITTCMKDRVELIDSKGEIQKVIKYAYEKQDKYVFPSLIKEITNELNSETLFSTYEINPPFKKVDFTVGRIDKKK